MAESDKRREVPRQGKARQGGRGSNDNTGKDSLVELFEVPSPARNYFSRTSSVSTRVNAARGKIGGTRCFEVFCCTQGRRMRLGFLSWCVSLLFPMPAIFSAAKPPRRNISRCTNNGRQNNHQASLTKFLVQCHIQSSGLPLSLSIPNTTRPPIISQKSGPGVRSTIPKSRLSVNTEDPIVLQLPSARSQANPRDPFSRNSEQIKNLCINTRILSIFHYSHRKKS